MKTPIEMSTQKVWISIGASPLLYLYINKGFRTLSQFILFIMIDIKHDIFMMQNLSTIRIMQALR